MTDCPVLVRRVMAIRRPTVRTLSPNARREVFGSFVYQLWLDSGEVTYVGQSAFPLQRLAEHTRKANSVWGKDWDFALLEAHETPEEMTARETYLIHHLHPRFNNLCYLCPNQGRRSWRTMTGNWVGDIAS